MNNFLKDQSIVLVVSSFVQVNRQKKMLKSQKILEEKNEGRLLQNLYGTWCPPGNQFQQYEIHFAPTSVQT